MPRGQLIQPRRGDAATWTSQNPTLAEGEIGLELDTGKFKWGDGATAWNDLAYIGGGGTRISDVISMLLTDITLAGDADRYSYPPEAIAQTFYTRGTDLTAGDDGNGNLAFLTTLGGDFAAFFCVACTLTPDAGSTEQRFFSAAINSSPDLLTSPGADVFSPAGPAGNTTVGAPASPFFEVQPGAVAIPNVFLDVYNGIPADSFAFSGAFLTVWKIGTL